MCPGSHIRSWTRNDQCRNFRCRSKRQTAIVCFRTLHLNPRRERHCCTVAVHFRPLTGVERTSERSSVRRTTSPSNPSLSLQVRDPPPSVHDCRNTLPQTPAGPWPAASKCPTASATRATTRPRPTRRTWSSSLATTVAIPEQERAQWPDRIWGGIWGTGGVSRQDQDEFGDRIQFDIRELAGIRWNGQALQLLSRSSSHCRVVLYKLFLQNRPTQIVANVSTQAIAVSVLLSLASISLHVLSLCVRRGARSPLPPCRPPITRLVRLDLPRLLALLGRAPNLPVGLSPLVARPHRECCTHCLSIHFPLPKCGLALAIGHVAVQRRGYSGIVRRWRNSGCEIACGLFNDGLWHLVGEHAQLSSADGVGSLWERVVLFEDDADVFAVFVPGGIAVVVHVTGDFGVDGVVAALKANQSGACEEFPQ